jgi:hypothetical protein
MQGWGLKLLIIMGRVPYMWCIALQMESLMVVEGTIG